MDHTVLMSEDSFPPTWVHVKGTIWPKASRPGCASHMPEHVWFEVSETSMPWRAWQGWQYPSKTAGQQSQRAGLAPFQPCLHLQTACIAGLLSGPGIPQVSLSLLPHKETRAELVTWHAPSETRELGPGGRPLAGTAILGLKDRDKLSLSNPSESSCLRKQRPLDN